MGRDPNEEPKETGKLKLERGLATGPTNLWALLGGKHKGAFVRLSVRRKGNADYMATVAATRAGDGAEYVCFGRGTDFVSAVMALNASVGKGKWVESRPFEEKDTGGVDIFTAPLDAEATDAVQDILKGL